jgi:hypothetical protein
MDKTSQRVSKQKKKGTKYQYKGNEMYLHKNRHDEADRA